MRLIYKYICFFILLFILSGCHRNPLNIDVSGIDLTVNIKRLDQELFKVTSENIQRVVPELQEKFEPFFNIYNQEILAIGNPHDSLYNGYLLTFLRDSMLVKSKFIVDSVFPNFDTQASQLELAFKHYKYYYPDLQIPTVYTYLSGFNQSIVATPNSLGISLDNYLGSENHFYRQLGIFEYKRRNMHPSKIVYDALHSWVSQQFEYKANNENLISRMIYQGKLQYFLDAMIPDGPDSLKIGYSKDQLIWCKTNEKEMWSYLVEKKMLFSGDRMEIVRFINQAPFTTPFGQKSPGRTGVWIGWQIVKNYMSKNPKVTIQVLMADNDYHKLLNDSGYSPD